MNCSCYHISNSLERHQVIVFSYNLYILFMLRKEMSGMFVSLGVFCFFLMRAVLPLSKQAARNLLYS